jgi:hypothetical protein
MTIGMILFVIASRQETGVEARSLLLWIRPRFDTVKISYPQNLVNHDPETKGIRVSWPTVSNMGG